MDKLKDLIAKKKQEKVDLIGADKKTFTKGELEAAKLLKIRQEEEEERKKKALKRQREDIAEAEDASKAARKEAEKTQEPVPVQLPRDEVIRRLRALGQPATLFGEEDYDRLRRLVKCETEMNVEDENRGGQQENVVLELQKQEREKMKYKGKETAASKAEGGGKAKDTGKGGAVGGQDTTNAHKVASGPTVPDQEGKEVTPEDETMAAFQKAAALLAEKRAEESLSVEERIIKWIKKWMSEWGEDLDKRPDPVKATPAGYQATVQYEQTKIYMSPLYGRLRQRSMHEELKAGLWMMVQAMRDRNYLYANDIYLRLAIGNAPWPIGVTSVGIHERSAREKISHVMNQSGQAHIMNDEATRKYLQAMKRLIGAVQRMYPTVPSRSVDFETTADPGRGMSGAGSTKLALLAAEAHGETVETLGLPAAPHFLQQDGKVMVPPKWKHILAKVQESMPDYHGSPARNGSPGP